LDEKSKQEILQKALTTESLKQEFEYTLPIRVERYLQVKPYGIIPNTPFAAPSAECSLLYRDGHFYACIALVQAVTEATVRYMCDINFKSHDKVFEKNVNKLYNRGFIDNRLKNYLIKIWEKRDDYHHLNSVVESDRQMLENLAKEKICLINNIEGEIFQFTTGNDGSIIPKNPKYWNTKDNKMNVFLRLEP
jgi:hypothetical protein